MDVDLLAGYLHTGSSSRAGAGGALLSNLTHSRLTSEADENNLVAGPSNPRVQIKRISNSNQLGIVISKMEKIFESITDCILDEKKELVIQLKSRSQKKQNLDENYRETPGKSTKITFPSQNAREAWKFTALLRILELSHEALVTGVVTTKRKFGLLVPRDIYYRDPELFMKQAVVDRYVDDIAYTFGVSRDALNVKAAAKGLVAGSFLVTRKDESVIDFTAEPDGVLVPNTTDMDVIQFIDVRWILVIEKEVSVGIVLTSEATFRTLATDQYWKDSIAGKGVLITAKGYPDIQTRKFLHILSSHYPGIPILALVDFDPDGIGIMSTYKYGSQALAHETNLAVPSIRWLGVQSCDFLGQDHGMQGLLKMSVRDRRIASKMLERANGEDRGVDDELKRELQVMLMLNVKAEIQILGNGEKLAEWLDRRLLGSV
ncbi:DNA topoisomerase IV, alpha subunit [Diplocarpon rosae]|nr:DNA topoisomerase IV, alpha subunit [Diplocarpon rosae]